MRDQDVVEVLYKGLIIVNTLLAWAGRTVSRRDLAEKTGLAPKQVGRYLNTLEALGFPLKRQRRGTEEMVAMQRDVQKRLRLLPFTTEELTALYFYTSLAAYVHDTTPLGNLHTACQKIATFLQHDLQHGSQLSGAFLTFAKHYKVYGTPQTQDVLHSLIPRPAQPHTSPLGIAGVWCDVQNPVGSNRQELSDSPLYALSLQPWAVPVCVSP